ncbi:MAG TPA: hypothetical protein VGK73_34635 [Polyangiaceae bacterium]
MRKLVLAVVGLTGTLALGCSSARDVEVTGEVSAAASAGVSGKILLDFMDIADEETPESVHTQTLDALGTFTATAPVEGDKVRIRAINDKNGDGACTAGEAWAEVDAAIAEDKVADVKLELVNQDCPVPAE